MYNFTIKVMRAKIIIVIVLTGTILVLAFLLFRPSGDQKSKENSASIKPKALTTITSETKKQTNDRV